MLNAKTLEDLKKKLLEEKARLEKDLAKLANKDGDDYEARFEEIGRSEEDNADEMEQYMDDRSVTETLERSLKEVEEALERIEQGTYGTCANCHQEIPVKRLEVYPSAKKCTGCASKAAE